MKKCLFAIIGFAALIFFSCTEESIDQETVEKTEDEVFLKSAATGITMNYVNTSISGMSYTPPMQVDLNHQAIGGSSYTSVYGFNVPEEYRVRGFRWVSADETTANWRPQGITCFSVTESGVTNRFLLVSWYGRNDREFQGTRVTLVNISGSTIDYRHIILVSSVNYDPNQTEYTQYGTFYPIPIHAGGLAYFNGKLYVASTGLGIRIFDVNKIVEVTTGTGTSTKCGKDSNGNMYAFGYRYILPEEGYYNIDGGAAPFSTLQINDEGTEIWTGQYYSSSSASSIVPKIYGFPIDASGNLLSTGIQVITPKNIAFADSHMHGIQGVFRKGNRTWITSSNHPTSAYGSTTRLARYTDGASDCGRSRWPYGAESLYYESKYDYLWCLTEFEPNCGMLNGSSVNRCVFAVKFSNYE